MATVTAAISISSRDLHSKGINISNSSVLTQAGITTGITGSTGLASKTLTQNTAFTLIDYSADDVPSAGHEKVYIKNTSTSSTQYVQVLLGSVEVGRLYGGDWLFMPTLAPDASDLKVTPSTTDSVTLEYMALY